MARGWGSGGPEVARSRAEMGERGKGLDQDRQEHSEGIHKLCEDFYEWHETELWGVGKAFSNSVSLESRKANSTPKRIPYRL